MGSYVYLAQEWRWGVPKIAIFEILEWESKFTLGPNAAKITDYIKKKHRMKIVRNSISYKKLSGHISLSLPGVEVEGSKDCHI